MSLITCSETLPGGQNCVSKITVLATWPVIICFIEFRLKTHVYYKTMFPKIFHTSVICIMKDQEEYYISSINMYHTYSAYGITYNHQQKWSYAKLRSNPRTILKTFLLEIKIKPMVYQINNYSKKRSIFKNVAHGIDFYILCYRQGLTISQY